MPALFWFDFNRKCGAHRGCIEESCIWIKKTILETHIFGRCQLPLAGPQIVQPFLETAYVREMHAYQCRWAGELRTKQRRNGFNVFVNVEYGWDWTVMLWAGLSAGFRSISRINSLFSVCLYIRLCERKMFANAFGFACSLQRKLRLRDGRKFNVQKYIDFSITFFPSVWIIKDYLRGDENILRNTYTQNKVARQILTNGGTFHSSI